MIALEYLIVGGVICVAIGYAVRQLVMNLLRGIPYVGDIGFVCGVIAAVYTLNEIVA